MPHSLAEERLLVCNQYKLIAYLKEDCSKVRITMIAVVHNL
jgi:uncharacterized protein YfbU (UPF0304 family)